MSDEQEMTIQEALAGRAVITGLLMTAQMSAEEFQEGMRLLERLDTWIKGFLLGQLEHMKQSETIQ